MSIQQETVDKLLSSTARRRAQVYNARETQRLKETIHVVDKMKFVSAKGYRREREALQQTLVNLRASNSLKSSSLLATSLPETQCKQKEPPSHYYQYQKKVARKVSSPEKPRADTGDKTMEAERRLSEPDASQSWAPRRQRATVESDIDEKQRRSFIIARKASVQRRWSVASSGVSFLESRLKRSNSIAAVELERSKLDASESKPNSPGKD